MTLSDLSIKRPVFAWMLMFGLIVFGAISLGRLGVSQMPDVDFPVLTVSATWENAAPEIMEAEIVDRIEEAVISVEGIRDITSNIRQGSASIVLEFDLKRDLDAALQEVQSAISRIHFPNDVDMPTIRKTNPDDQPIIMLGVRSDERSLHDLIVYVDKQIKDQFQVLSGVGEIQLRGFSERNLRVWVDNDKLKEYELTILDVRKAIELEHAEIAAGIIENDQKELNLRTMGEGLTAEDVANILISQRGGRPVYNTTIRIKDVARVEDGLTDIRRIARFNGKPGVGLAIKKQRGSNAVEVARGVKRYMETISKTLPKDISMMVNFDTTTFIEDSIRETEFTLILSALATGLVCWLFLGSWSSTVNVLLSIPTSIMGSFIIVYFMGFTLNLFTLLALALAVGIVVDDAIMVLENIVRHMEMGQDRMKAATVGAREITFAAVAASVAVVAIFLPVAFMEGIIGKFFFQFGVTLSGAVLLSLLEAITLTPMRCSQFLNQSAAAGGIIGLIERAFRRLAEFYRRALSVALDWRWSVILVSMGLFAVSLLLVEGVNSKIFGESKAPATSKIRLNPFRIIRGEFIPPQDQSMFMIRFQTPVGSSLAFTSETVRKVEEFMLSRPEVLRFACPIGGDQANAGFMFVTLKPRAKRKLSQSRFMDVCRIELKKIPNLRCTLQDLSTRGFTAQRGFPVEFNIRGGDWKTLQQKADEIVKQLDATGLVTDLDTDYRAGMPEVRVWPDRPAAAVRGVSIDTIGKTVNAAIGGVRQGKFTKEGRRYDVRLRLDPEERDEVNDIKELQVRNNYGELLPITDVVRIETVPTLQTIVRRNRERSISIFANIASGKSQATALATAQEIGRKALPEGYRLFLSGGAQTFLESLQSLFFALWLGVLVAYMILASQFNSFLHPFTVLLSLPFSLSGALVALSIGDQTLNLYSAIGIILLMGIVKKNSILLVEFTNKQRYENKLPLREAILKASPIRLRPILMTSLSTVAAAIPPALALGPGAETRIPMAITVIGGVLVSTAFTLLVVPCAYSLLARLERHTPVSTGAVE